jgi:hypothetical protein
MLWTMANQCGNGIMSSVTSSSDPKFPVVHFGKYMFVLGPRVWIALVLAAVIIVIGFATNPTNPLFGGLIAISTVLGLILGVLLQVVPAPEDHSQRIGGALRALATITDSVRDTSSMVDRLALATLEETTKVGLLAVQADLLRTIKEIDLSMLDWEFMSPGSLERLVEDRAKGQKALERLSNKLEGIS